MFNSYFDNGATSFPKPTAVAEYITRYLTECGGTYGRSSYGRTVEATSGVEQCRDLLATSLGLPNANGLVLTSGATFGANMVLKGIGFKSGRVLVSPLEHNAVMRPLEQLCKASNTRLKWEVLPHFSDGIVDVEALRAINLSDVKLVIVNHASNVNGAIQPIEAIKKALGGVALMVDVSQSLGHIEVEAARWGLDYLFFTGHKGLYGPSGTGGVYIKEPQTVSPLVTGGTGSNSHSYDMPTTMPDIFEAGTPNIVGFYGLLGALENRPLKGHTPLDFKNFLSEIKTIPNITIYCANSYSNQIELFSVSSKTKKPSTIAFELLHGFGIETRSGLHCSPLAHRSLGTFSDGTLRISLSAYHTPSDLEQMLNALKEVL